MQRVTNSIQALERLNNLKVGNCLTSLCSNAPIYCLCQKQDTTPFENLNVILMPKFFKTKNYHFNVNSEEM